MGYSWDIYGMSCDILILEISKKHKAVALWASDIRIFCVHQFRFVMSRFGTSYSQRKLPDSSSKTTRRAMSSLSHADPKRAVAFVQQLENKTKDASGSNEDTSQTAAWPKPNGLDMAGLKYEDGGDINAPAHLAPGGRYPQGDQ